MPPVISVEHLSKSYRLGQIGTGTFARDLSVWWARVRGKPNPLLRIGETDHGNRMGEEMWALRDVSFTVDQGEVLGVIGRNGAGKSTLLKILSRVTAPTSGQVKVRGRIASLLEVGTGFHPELTGRENIYLNGAILGMTRQEVRRKFDEIVAFAGIEQFIGTPVKRYSTGMFVRLAFAVAAFLESEILLIDEVLAVGDAEFQKKCLGKMGDLASKEGRTVLFVSHNMGAVRNLCPKSLIIKRGVIQYTGDSTEVINKYLESTKEGIGNSTPGEIDCSDLPHSGSGEARITWARMINSENNPSLSFEMDKEIKIEFRVSNPLRLNLNYAIEILDENDYPLYHFESEYEPQIEMANKISNENPIVTAIIPPLHLFPDNYVINLWVGLHHTRVDKVERCFNFRVLKQKELNRELLTTRGRFFAESKWMIN
ncbi:ABC transporter ATP-binding protein [Levilinea saccharolytica]|uniref:ABC transporter domain-containing protein n=1 Tax=Levilinea saccharolytica TaxID=229921 RepID=A0A0P6X675_9CHLR|nr:ABC transporter ATP-binding protein [Levilinea saccharolytica]KPL77454.1 hypothetical protein ADN01_16320 [Levilinea saccharolytica]GAP18824.1 ABC-type polysaccharide/polyol phosphate transport system, ATPase component [Levilinea saccharolytica]